MMKRTNKKTQSEILADKNARANRIRKELAGIVGSPFRENQMIDGKKKMPKTKRGGKS